MRIGVLKETREGETRVALVPDAVPKLLKLGVEVLVEPGAGVASGFGPALYHLGSDPQELVNLLPERPQDGKRLAEALDTWIRRYPTPSTLGRELSASERSALDAMGYAGEGGQAKPEGGK